MSRRRIAVVRPVNLEHPSQVEYAPMTSPDAALEDQLKALIVETLALEDVEPASIESAAPLFGEGLGLDSIDALEIALAIHAKFGVRTAANDERNREYYHSVRSLADFIRAKQAEARAGTNA